MSTSDHSVITSFQLSTASEEDYQAHRSINPKNIVSGANYRPLLLNAMGYNPGSPLGNRQECSVCGKSGSECISHPVVLDMSSLDTVFLSEFGLSTVKKLTSIICTRCKTVVKDKKNVARSFEELFRLPKTRYVCECVKSAPTIQLVDEEKIPESERQVEWRDGRKRQKRRTYIELTTPAVQAMKLISETDLSSLHLKRELILGLFFNKMILLPTSVHPMNFRRSRGSGVDDVTAMISKYSDLISSVSSQNIPEIRTIQRSLTVSTANDRFSGTPSHMMVCDQKTGLLRGSGQNKRAKLTARSVLTPNIYGRSSELRCPKFIMRNLHYEYVVSVHSKEWLQSEAGKTVTYLVVPLTSSTTNSRNTYKRISAQTMLKLGDRVLKELSDGDYVVFFRNPTLWRHSLIGYQVKEWNNYCIGLHETNTAGHNADFDGDEGNLSVGADLASRIEMQMMDAAYQLFSGRSGEPIISITYNGIVGAYVLSTDDNIDPLTFNKLKGIIEMKGDLHDTCSRFRELVIDESYYRGLAKKYDIPYRSGRTLISMLLPRTLNYERKDVVIKGGFMLSGKLRAADVSKGLITAIYAIDRWRMPYLFVDRGYAMMSAYISTKALTISARDYVMPGDLRKQIIPDGFEQKLIEVEKEIVELEESKTQRTKASIQRIEENISHTLGKLSKTVEKLLIEGEYNKTNGSIISYMSEARGSVGNIAATVVNVGQMYTGSERYDPSVSRSSYYIPRDSKSIFDRGFIRSSYAKGLTPAEVMIAANAARHQALNTYLGTPISGQTAKQTAFHQADIHLSETISVVDRNGKVLDCIYGYACDSTTITYRKLPIGNIELPIDPIALLNRINIKRGITTQ